MAESKVSDLEVGEVLNNTYRLDLLIGQGGMGRVFQATDLKLDRKVAVKALLATSLDTETMRRFDRETQVMGQLDHPGVVTLYSFGRTRGVPWLAMRLLEGQDLWAAVAACGGRMSPQQLLPIVRQVLTALAYVHGRGLLHRDLKPSNIHIGKNGKVTLCDLGLARGHTSSLTRTGIVWGTPEYMAPEQITGERELDGRADLYALAVVMFRMLVGRALFGEDGDPDLLRAHVSKPRPDASRLVPGLSPLVGAALQKALAIHPEDRFQSAAEMLQAFELVLALPAAAPPPRSSAPGSPPKRVEGTKVQPAPRVSESMALTADEDEPATRREGFAQLNPLLDDATDAAVPTNRDGFTSPSVSAVSATPTPASESGPSVPWSEERTVAAAPAISDSQPALDSSDRTERGPALAPLDDSAAERTRAMPAVTPSGPQPPLPVPALIIGAVLLFLLGLLVSKLLL